MKQRLTAVESAELIKMGVDPSKATDMVIESIPIEEIDGVMRGIETPLSVFSLGDIIAMLPKCIIDRNILYHLYIWIDPYTQQRCAAYRDDKWNDYTLDTFQSSEELCDALFALLKWTLENPEYTKL